MDPQQFSAIIRDYYQQHGRHLPWRLPNTDGNFDAYKIMVSEIMLQQTQVNRVITKYTEFLSVFPDVATLASASLASVLILWSGLGYNRRAKFLWQAAQQLAAAPQPWTYQQLVVCPGIGPNTAAAIVVYAYNQPKSFVETNIRTVYIHHYFHDQTAVPDKLIINQLEASIDQTNPREFFWGVMDYGSHLKATIGNLSRQSVHYAKQPKFEGSKRQLRGKVLRDLALQNYSLTDLVHLLADKRAGQVIEDLVAEGLIENYRGKYRLRAS